RSFLEVAYRLAPQRLKLFDSQSWDEIGLLTLEGRPLALFVPGTLVCPVRDYEARSFEDFIPWVKNGRFVDVHLRGLLQQDECQVLSKYCEQLIANLHDLAGREQAITRRLDRYIELLDHFRADLDREVVAPALPTAFRSRQDGLAVPRHRA